VRALLEFLGIVGPHRIRRDPVALPDWLRRVGSLLVPFLAAVSTLVLALVRAVWS
jgi:hypothetical protein